MELISDLIKTLLPAGLVLYAMYLTVKTLIDKMPVQHPQIGHNLNTHQTLLPLRLQAYERMTLFLERIAPNNILMRLGGQGVNVLDFQQILLAEIREEFSHNLAQQVYISSPTWDAIKRAMQETTTLINVAARDLDPNGPALELSKKIFDIVLNQGVSPSDDALKVLKRDFQDLFL